MRPIAFLFPALLAASGSSVPAADTIHVPGDQPTIQAGIDLALDGDTVLVAPGTYVEHVRFKGRSIEVRSASGPAKTTIKGSLGGPVVTFNSGEGPDTVLEGFTITGGWDINGGGINCDDSSPTVRGNVVTGNHAQGGHGGGLGGGIAAFDSALVLENNRVLANTNGFGTGAGICLVRCTAIVRGNDIAGNKGASPPDSFGGGLVLFYDNSAVHHNTIVGNEASQGGGILCYWSTADIRDNIVWDNTASLIGDQLYVDGVGVPTIEYNDVQGGWSGTGNLDLDPLFQDPGAYDYTLTPASPCIDMGDPASAPDPDGTRADMGARPLGQFVAAATVRNGSGANALRYAPTTTPVLGTTWAATVDTTGHAGATISVLFGFAAQGTPFFTGAGEVLVDPTSELLFLDAVVPLAGLASHALPVPLDYALSGLTLPSQALVLGGGPELCNAVDLRLGL